MPSKRVVDYFGRTFGDRIDGRVPDPNLAFRLSMSDQQPTAIGQHLNEIDLSENLRRRAIVIAQASSFGAGTRFVPLAKRFGVSPTAMAIQLEELGLVI